MMLNDLWEAIRPMRHSRLKNYITPGLTSHLVGGGENFGKVRIFEAERNTRDTITPHSHRFPFTALVLAGEVQNTIYVPAQMRDEGAELWIRSTITQVCGAQGLEKFKHEREKEPKWYRRSVADYCAGGTYRMQHHEIHSIVFSKGAKVLFLEGPTVQDWDWMLEPWVDGKLVPTFETKPWMFDRE